MGPVVVIGYGKKPGVAEAVHEWLPILERDFGVAGVDMDQTMDVCSVDAKWALLFGGDGALLNLSRRMHDRVLPTLTVNFGRLGFLTEVEFKNLGEALDRIRDGKFQLRERMRLSAQVGADWFHYALNDVVLTGVHSGRVFHVSAKVGGHEALRYAGDGVVVATPSGSTAYSLAAGGPILSPELEATVITPLCAHALAHRSLVVPAGDEIVLYLRKHDPMGRVIVDGQISRELRLEDRVIVRPAKEPFVLIRVGTRSHYSRLRKILGWGGRPKYAP